MVSVSLEGTPLDVNHDEMSIWGNLRVCLCFCTNQTSRAEIIWKSEYLMLLFLSEKPVV